MLPADPINLPGDSLTGNAYAKSIKAIAAGVEAWTMAVFGKRFTSTGRSYAIGGQTDSHSCGVCVINAINASMNGTELFTRETRSKYRLQYFITAAEYLLKDTVRSLPTGYSPICSPPPRTRLKWIWQPSLPQTLRSHRSSCHHQHSLPQRRW